MAMRYESSPLKRVVSSAVAVAVAIGLAAGNQTIAWAARPFVYHEGLIFLECRVNQMAALCLLDTGANVSAIDIGLAERLGLAKLRDSRVTGTTGTVPVAMVRIDELTIHGETARDLEVTRRDIQHGATPDGRRLDMIVGYDFLKGRALQIDFKNRALNYSPRGDECDHWLDMELDDGIPRVAATLESKHETWLRIDTGASLFATKDVYVNLTQRDAEALMRLRPDMQADSHLSATGIGGEVRLPVYRLESMRLGGLEVRQPFGIVQPAQGYFARPDAVGFFGNNLLEQHTPIVLDFRGGRLGFTCRETTQP